MGRSRTPEKQASKTHFTSPKRGNRPCPALTSQCYTLNDNLRLHLHWLCSNVGAVIYAICPRRAGLSGCLATNTVGQGQIIGGDHTAKAKIFKPRTGQVHWSNALIQFCALEPQKTRFAHYIGSRLGHGTLWKMGGPLPTCGTSIIFNELAVSVFLLLCGRLKMSYVTRNAPT
jgi:hypothetical protein